MNADTPQTRRSRTLFRTGLLFVGIVAGVCVAWSVWCRPAVRAERALREAREHQSAGRIEQAEESARRALDLDGTLGAAALLAAECAAARLEFERAVDYASRVPADEPDLRLRAALLAARLHDGRLHRFTLAEEAYRAALDVDPDNRAANEGLARLLGLCGRRREAVPHVLRVVRSGESTDLLMMLARENVVVREPGRLEQARDAAPDDPNPLIGLAWHAAEENQPERAIELLREAVALSPDHAAAHVALGAQLLSAGRFDELAAWSGHLPASADGFPECWQVRARLAEREDDAAGALRCYWEAVRLAPESKPAVLGLVRLLAETGRAAESGSAAEHLRRLQELERVQTLVLSTGNAGGDQSLLRLAQSYEAAGRLWEALGWCAAAAAVAPGDPRAAQSLDELRRKTDGLPLQVTVDAANPALALDLSGSPLPDFRNLPGASAAPDVAAGPPVSFRNDAATAGLTFRYFNGTDGPPTRRMYEFSGGGVAVLDYDRDDAEDVYFTQGCVWPAGSDGERDGDRLFRNASGERFDDATGPARIRESDFGQGATVGDVNADGFPDLYVANIGPNRLWINNGDGTFFDATAAAGIVGESWTTSCVLADLDGDSLPDIYDVNYLTGDDLFERVCRDADGSPRLCMPFHFDGAVDVLWRNDGSGGFEDATQSLLPITPDGKGLGAAVWDAWGAGRLSLFVANDTTPNFFFSVRGDDDGGRFTESAVPGGLALNEDGKAEGCMGIAIADVDDDGRLDVHVTNFLAESNTLYLNVADGLYDDATRQTGLRPPTLDFLGFGTQFLDADLDGRLELFVTNGHIDELPDRPYRMVPQWFRWESGRAAAIQDEGAYSQQQWLGRAVARIDWNRDGREDLLVGHLADDSALLTNGTPASGRFLTLRLNGVQSNRDAIGTTVRTRVGARTLVRQLTAGDGYQASNERRIHFGVGADVLDELTVHWPSGIVQRFENVQTNRRLLLREGGRLLAAPSSSPLEN